MLMVRRLLMLFSVLALTCAFGLVSVPTGTFAAGAYGVGPSQTGATGTTRACEATALNYGRSYANGVQCPTGTPTLSFQLDQSTCVLTLTGSGLIPGTEVFISTTSLGYGDAGMVDAFGNFTASYVFSQGFSDTFTPAAYAVGQDPNAGGTPYFTGTAFSFSC